MKGDHDTVDGTSSSTRGGDPEGFGSDHVDAEVLCELLLLCRELQAHLPHLPHLLRRRVRARFDQHTASALSCTRLRTQAQQRILY
eukprot:3146575-Rhodomonas_salina.3